MSSSVVLPSEFKIENVSFNPPKKNNQGGQSVLVSYYNEITGRNGPLLLQTPRCRMPFGSDISDGDKKTRKYSVNISLALSDSENENLVKFTEILTAIDTKAKLYSRGEGATAWFGKVHSEDMINELYKSGIKKSKNDKYADTLKVKLPVRISGEKLTPQFDIYNDKKTLQVLVNDDSTEINLDCFAKGGEYTGIIQCTGVWFVGSTSFGVGYKTVQAKISGPSKLVGYQIVDEEELVEEEEEEDDTVG